MKKPHGRNGRPNGLGGQYPWDRWLASGAFLLVQGVDFWGRPDTMTVQVRRAAAKRGLHVSIRQHPVPHCGTVTLSVVVKEKQVEVATGG